MEPVEPGGAKRGGGGKGGGGGAAAAGAAAAEGQQEQQEAGGPAGGRYFKLAEVEVAKASDFGVNDTTYRCLTHLGAVLQPGDSVMGWVVWRVVCLFARLWFCGVVCVNGARGLLRLVGRFVSPP